MSCENDISNKAQELEIEMKKAIHEFIESSQDKLTLEQWREDVKGKIINYRDYQEMSVRESCKATFNHLKQRQDVDDKQQNYKKIFLKKATNFVLTQKINKIDFDAAFEKE